jgi:hypothetical protein
MTEHGNLETDVLINGSSSVWHTTKATIAHLNERGRAAMGSSTAGAGTRWLWTLTGRGSVVLRGRTDAVDEADEVGG